MRSALSYRRETRVLIPAVTNTQYMRCEASPRSKEVDTLRRRCLRIGAKRDGSGGTGGRSKGYICGGGPGSSLCIVADYGGP